MLAVNPLLASNWLETPNGFDYVGEFDRFMQFKAFLDKSAANAAGIETKYNIPKAKRQNWRTPAWLRAELIKEFNFDLDAAADYLNALCKVYITENENALSVNWSDHGKRVFLNPPFDQITPFLQKVLEQLPKLELVVALLPVRSGSKWFYEFVHKPIFAYGACGLSIDAVKGEYYYGFVSDFGELRILQSRLKFDDTTTAAPFDCCLAIYRGGQK